MSIKKWLAGLSPRIECFLDLVLMKGAHSLSAGAELSLGTETAEANFSVLALSKYFPKDDDPVCQDEESTLCDGSLVALHGICT